MAVRFHDRRDAGRALAGPLRAYAGRQGAIVLGLPRGGVPVAAEVARALAVPLDIFLVRKLGVPGHEELAFGAIAQGGVRVLHEALVHDVGLTPAAIDRIAAREQQELQRRSDSYRHGRSTPDLKDRIVILVDDGLATGATMEAAVQAARQSDPAKIIVAVPVGAIETCRHLATVADEVVCLSMPEPFVAVGLWYEDFRPTTDEEVRELLDAADDPPSDGSAPRDPPADAKAAPPTDSKTDPAADPPADSPADPAPARASAESSAGPAGQPPAARQASPASDLPALIRQRALGFGGDASAVDPLVDLLGDARVVLLGEATHGTHEFYRQRALITRRLIAEKGFSAVAVEADWPDAYRVNRYVRGVPGDGDAVESLGDFRRFPAWMWRNADVLDFVGWLRSHNEGRPEDARAGFYGLDLYSLHASMRAVLAYLDKIDLEAAARARQRYACFDRFGAEPQEYAWATHLGLSASCEREVVDQLVDVRRRAAEFASRDGRVAADEYFVAEQNARVVRDAEAYYRTMMRGRADSWNLRDRHMMQTLEGLLHFLEARGPAARVVVWAHNSHLGDARATEMGHAGELNVGQLARQRFGDHAMLVGWTSHAGTVTAATEWGGPAHRRHLRPALPDSLEALFHRAGTPRFVLPLRTDAVLTDALLPPRLERAVGVVYLPEQERRSHYFQASLPQQFDVVLHFDETRAVEPLERTGVWDRGEVAETYPSGL